MCRENKRQLDTIACLLTIMPHGHFNDCYLLWVKLSQVYYSLLYSD